MYRNDRWENGKIPGFPAQGEDPFGIARPWGLRIHLGTLDRGEGFPLMSWDHGP